MEQRRYKAIFFDLDGTLLPMDMDAFLMKYFKLLNEYAAGIGLDAARFSNALNEGVRAMATDATDRMNDVVFWSTFHAVYGDDDPGIDARIEEFYGTEIMPKMPLRLQEAAVAANEKDLDWCRQHGVDEKVIDDYMLLRATLLQQPAQAGGSPEALMKWRYTYWYYLLVTSPNMAKMREALQRRQQQQNAQQMSAH